jgi:choline kinase
LSWDGIGNWWWWTTTQTDATGEIARGFAGVTVMPANDLEKGWTGKANAIWTAARKARGRWLLFTDADTVHEPGDLRRAIHEAQRNKAGMLSYSPRQLASGLAQRTADAAGFL